MDTMVITYGVATVAILAFVVSVIIEVIKNIGPLKHVPTDLIVIANSMWLCGITYRGAIDYLERAFVWYEFAMAIVGSFIVAYVAMFGWEKLSNLWKRFNR